MLSRGLAIAIGVAAMAVAALGLRACADVVAPVFLALVLRSPSNLASPARPARSATWLGTVLTLVAVYAFVADLVA